MAGEPPPLLPGESRYVWFPLNGSMALVRPGHDGYDLKPIGLQYTNYQLSIVFEDTRIDLPLMLLESLCSVRSDDVLLGQHMLEITTKSVWSFRIAFMDTPNLEKLLKTHERALPRDLDSVFAFAYKPALLRSGRTPEDDRGWRLYSPQQELHRQLTAAAEGGADALAALAAGGREPGCFRVWKYNWNIPCGHITYPKEIVVPAALPDQTLLDCLAFRSKGRVPAISWLHPKQGGVLARASQPLIGLRGASSAQDKVVCNMLATRRAKPQWNPASPDAPESAPGNASFSGRPAETPATPAGAPGEVVHKQAALQFVDARSQVAATANMARGGGYEEPKIYTVDGSRGPPPNISFFGMANIHVIRESFLKLRHLCTGFSNVFEAAPGMKDGNHAFWAKLEDSQWYLHIQRILWGAVRIVDMLERGDSVLVHCSDGWDRTPQLTATSMLLLDPYYRTTLGLITLIEQEWVRFGHKFDERSNHCLMAVGAGAEQRDDADDDTTVSPQQSSSGPGAWLKKLKGPQSEGEKAQEHLSSQRSPIFIQWIDTVYQIMVQFPNEFEYTPELLQFIVDHVYSCQYGTFLCNNEYERDLRGVKERAWSLWTDLLDRVDREREAVQRLLSLAEDAEMPETAFLNPMYNPEMRGRPLHPSHNSKHLTVWASHFFRFDSAPPHVRPRQRPSLFDSSSSAAMYRLMMHTRTKLLQQLQEGQARPAPAADQP